VASTGHDAFAETDYGMLRKAGICTVREGLRWHLIEQTRGKYDFASAMPMVKAAKLHGIEIVWDLFHFGWPGFLDIFQQEWVESFVGLAAAFGRFLREEMPGPAFVAPVNEISFFAWGGGDEAFLNPFATGRGAELKRQMVRAVVQASDALHAELPGVRLVAPEPVIHIAGDPKRPEDVDEAAQYTSSMFEAWDMISGRVQPELGGSESYLDIVGINYYDRNQWWNHGRTIWRNEPEYRPFRDILAEVYARYQRPMFISETGTEDADRPFWLAYIAQETRAAMQAGVPMEGICLYPILNHPGWVDDRHCFNGLWDYPGPHGEREIYKPLADELERQQKMHKQNYENPRSNRCNLLFTPEMEFRVSEATAPDEPLRPGPPGVLC
jgi:beta-glucosidase/6-phospho-beta-glucosidase/beta-galactosidase